MKSSTKKASSWKLTPFESVEQGRAVAEKFGYKPGPIDTDVEKGMKFFTIFAKREKTIIAQRIFGGPVMEKVTRLVKRDIFRVPEGVRIFREEMRLICGAWILSEHKTLSDVEVYWRKQFANFDNVEVVKIILYRIDGDEYEYGLDKNGELWERVLGVKK